MILINYFVIGFFELVLLYIARGEIISIYGGTFPFFILIQLLLFISLSRNLVIKKTSFRLSYLLLSLITLRFVCHYTIVSNTLVRYSGYVNVILAFLFYVTTLAISLTPIVKADMDPNHAKNVDTQRNTNIVNIRKRMVAAFMPGGYLIGLFLFPSAIAMEVTGKSFVVIGTPFSILLTTTVLLVGVCLFNLFSRSIIIESISNSMILDGYNQIVRNKRRIYSTLSFFFVLAIVIEYQFKEWIYIFQIYGILFLTLFQYFSFQSCINKKNDNSHHVDAFSLFEYWKYISIIIVLSFIYLIALIYYLVMKVV